MSSRKTDLSWGQRLLIAGIRLYQRTLSLDHGPLRGLRPHGQCKFHPTCSVYAIQSIERYGCAKGIGRSAKRVLRCHPWAEGGIDEVSDAQDKT